MTNHLIISLQHMLFSPPPPPSPQNFKLIMNGYYLEETGLDLHRLEVLLFSICTCQKLNFSPPIAVPSLPLNADW